MSIIIGEFACHWMNNTEDPDQLASSEARWPRSTRFSKMV